MHPLIDTAKRENRHLLEPDVLQLIKDHGIDIPNHLFIHSKKEALEAATTIGLPIVMKIVSQSIIHKTESGGVFLNLRHANQIKDAYSHLDALLRHDGTLEGIIVYPYQEHEIELYAGMVRDAQFGPVITFGLGGIWIEVFNDLAYGIAPLSNDEADEMIKSIRAYPILEGTRGEMPIDRQAFCDILVRLSHLAIAEPLIQEIDLNPIFPLENGYFIADARMILH